MTLELLDLDGGDRVRPNVSGDLPTLFRAGPQFRRTLTGYDRFQVDTYVQWAEEELATADREREHLEARQLRTSAALQEAQDRKSTRLNSSHANISYAVFCLKKKILSSDICNLYAANL